MNQVNNDSKLNKKIMISTLVLAALSSVAVTNACTEKKDDSGKDGGTGTTQPTPSPGPVTIPSSTPTTNNTTPPAGPPVTAPIGGVAAPAAPQTLELFSQIKEGQHGNATYADRTRLLTKEAQRCRINNASLIKPGAIYSGINPHLNPDEIVSIYRNKHHFPNFSDPCRQELGLTGSFGRIMKLENLIALENCSRNSDIQTQQNLEARTVSREILMMENLILLCRLGDENLTPLVQNALSAAFVGAWVDLGK